MRVRAVILLCITAFIRSVATGQSVSAVSTGAISGSVVNASGTGLAADVRVARWGAQKQSAKVASGADGSFTLSGLPAGLYSICATASSTAYADGCLWGVQSPVSVSAGSTASGQTVSLETAALLQVSVNDPGSLLTLLSGVVKPHLMVGVLTDDKRFVSLSVTGSTSTGRSHAIRVPADRSVSLLVVAHGFTVASPAALGAGANNTPIPVTVSSTQANSPVVFTLTGGGN
jgi:hypothetical protein